MAKRNAPKQFSAYLVTASDEPSMPVGSTLIDKGALITRDWNVINFESGKTTGAVGVRLVRLCPNCRVDHRSVGVLGHDGKCGASDVVEEARQEIAHAVKRADNA